MTGQERELTNYLATYSTEALTEPEIIAQIEGRGNTMKGKGGKKMQIKRLGKDEDDVFWFYGKIHGLENICYLTKEQILACNGNPIALQIAVNNAKVPKGEVMTYEQRVAKFK